MVVSRKGRQPEGPVGGTPIMPEAYPKSGAGAAWPADTMPRLLYLKFRDSLTEMDSRFRGNDGSIEVDSRSAFARMAGNDGQSKSNAPR